MKLFSIIIIVTAVLIGLAACKSSFTFTGEPKRTLEEPIVINRFLDDTYQIIFHQKGSWRVFKSENQKDLFVKEPFLEFIGDTILIKEDVPENKRLFFGFINTEKNDTSLFIKSERLIALEGQPNFRDIGGVPIDSGRYVKWGKIYRSGDLHDLTDEDLNYLQNLNIQTIIDFRNHIEVEDEPDRVPKDSEYIHSPIAGERGIQEYKRLKRHLVTHRIRRLEAKNKFKEYMEGFVDEAAEDLKPVMDKLMNPESVPLVYHCSGGKDRTGAMTSIILLTLGANEKTVRDEYLMSNYYRWELNQDNIRRGRKVLIGKETLEYIFVVQEEYINAVFDVINNKYDGIDNYLLEKFGIDETDRNWLKAQYTYVLEDIEDDVLDENTVSNR